MASSTSREAVPRSPARSDGTAGCARHRRTRLKSCKRLVGLVVVEWKCRRSCCSRLFGRLVVGVEGRERREEYGYCMRAGRKGLVVAVVGADVVVGVGG